MTDAEKVYDLMKRFCSLEKGHPDRPTIMLEVKHIIDFPTTPNDSFDQFWKAYPLKVAKGAAEKAWPKAIKAAPLEVIISGVEWYKRNKPDDVSWAHPASWLNAKRWLDGQYKPRVVDYSHLQDWQASLLKRMGEPAFNAWIKDAQRDGALLKVQTKHARDFIKTHLDHHLKHVGIDRIEVII